MNVTHMLHSLLQKSQYSTGIEFMRQRSNVVFVNMAYRFLVIYAHSRGKC